MEWLEGDLGPGIRGGFTGSDANLSLVVGADAARAGARRADLGRLVGAPVRFARQVHGTAVLLHGADHVPDLVQVVDGEQAADVVVCANPAVAVGVLVADCVPVLLADPVAGVVAAVHAGRRGLAAGVLSAAVTAMVDLGAAPARLRAVVGPAICGRCYEVPPELRDAVAAQVPGTASTTSWGPPALDLPAGVRGCLADLGVDRVHDVAACTFTDPRWFSHRATGATGGRGGGPRPAPRAAGRFAGVVRPLPGS